MHSCYSAATDPRSDRAVLGRQTWMRIQPVFLHQWNRQSFVIPIFNGHAPSANPRQSRFAAVDELSLKQSTRTLLLFSRSWVLGEPPVVGLGALLRIAEPLLVETREVDRPAA